MIHDMQAELPGSGGLGFLHPFTFECVVGVLLVTVCVVWCGVLSGVVRCVCVIRDAGSTQQTVAQQHQP